MAEQFLQWQIISDVKALSALQPKWQSLIEKCDCQHVFNSPEWLLTWMQVYWQPKWQLHSLAGFDDEQLVAFLPLYIQPSKNSYQLSQALPLGIGEPEVAEVASEYIDCLAHPDYTPDIIDKLRSFISELPVDFIGWRAALNDQIICQAIAPKPDKSNVGRYLVNTESWKQSNLSKNNQKKIARLSNKLMKANATCSWLEPEQYDTYWEKLVSFHQARWQHKGYSGAFIASEFNQFHQLFRAQSSGIKMSCLTVGGHVVAIHYYFSSNNTLYFYQSGWQQGHYSAFSPSYMLHLWSIEHCEEKYYDFMMAGKSASYKQQFLGEFEPMQNLRIIKSKKKAFVAKIVNKLLHKIVKQK
jgi:CelD/BcsL family acetyltransferase involved in cellulose biosynthesis